MSIKIVDEVHESLIDDAWELYHEAFRELNALAVQRHLMYRDEFDQVMLDARVRKYLCLGDDGSLCGLSTYTNHLEAVPLISPAYFARRWPEHYARRRIWYVVFVAVRQGAPVTAFPELIGAMHQTSTRDSITALDVCARTDEVRHLPRSVRALLRRISGPVRMERLDQQSYWLYDFPEPAA
ncbi:hypothetical protein [Rhizomonospora bruguierae]|uniref:hypothetical protein n=1 Tax=Rhizomonospora bruguierae TaxID=1581705 RepID=UPI001BD0D5B1|nr:hypothetical protein [Micromonospora sp. NBRC 107566]